MEYKPKVKTKGIVVRELESEVLIYDLNGNRALCLNETSALVWNLCDGKRSVGQINDELSERLKIPASNDLIYLALDQLGKDGLLEDEITGYFEGLTRREIIKKVGFVSAVALPVVSSIVAPEAFMAQSACVPGAGAGSPNDACSADSQCSNCNCTGTGEVICCAPGVSHANPLTTNQIFCETAASCATSITATLRCCGTGTASPAAGMCPSPGQIACACN